MNQFIFKSRWIAISFAVLMLFSAYMLVGSEDDGNALGDVQDTAVGEGEETAQLAETGTGEDTQAIPEDTEFVDDEELIDDAGGEDPSPGEDGGDYSDYSGDPDDGPQFASEIGVEDSGDGGEMNGDE